MPKVTPIKEMKLDPRSIVIAATTKYPNWYKGESLDLSNTDKVRGDLAIQSIDAAIKHGYAVVINDGESSSEFKEELAKRGIIVLERSGKSRAAARRQLIEYSSQIPQAKVIVRTEPEKVSLVDDCTPQLVEPILRGEADIIVPKRQRDLFSSSYPDYMYESEMDANKKYNDILHEFELLPQEEELDIFFGPTVCKNDPEIIKLFLERYELRLKTPYASGVGKYVSPDDFSNSQMFAIVKALRLGLKVKVVKVPFIYPKIQKENEEIDRDSFVEKRKKQKWGILDELVLYIRYLDNPDNPKSVLKRF
ncbi:MAG: hypothetical protein HY344_04760 [Candidatus Levybacteria bacterium]|nr:hypothetical protein [Candidatus Levybacteria bacterium]